MTGKLPEPISLSVEDAAAAAGVKRQTILRAIHAGTLRAKRTSTDTSKFLISVKALTDWFNGLEDA